MALPDNTMLVSQTPKVTSTPTIPPTRTPRADTGTLHKEVILLHREMNRAMGCLLMTKASIDALGRKQVSDFEMAIHQNEVEATKAIREVKVHCGAAIREAASHHATAIREAEACSSTTITEAEACCASYIREVESHCVDHAYTIQQSHSNNMQHLERKEIEEEGKDFQSFLATWGMALQACPLEDQGVLSALSNY